MRLAAPVDKSVDGLCISRFVFHRKMKDVRFFLLYACPEFIHVVHNGLRVCPMRGCTAPQRVVPIGQWLAIKHGETGRCLT